MSTFNVYEYVFPIVGETGQEPNRELREMCGTAFPLGGGVFITAGHVLRQALTFEAGGLGFPEGNGLGTTEMADPEILAEYDIGLFRAVKPPQAATTYRWKTEALRMVDPVHTTGFPYAWDPENRVIAAQGFSGHTVCGRKLFRLPSTPLVYELSFACPRGLSGAPLWGASRPAPWPRSERRGYR